jgi:hypothetical protein
MTVLRLVLLISFVALTVSSEQTSTAQHPVAPASCPVTLAPAVPFTPPGEHKLDNSFWLGTEKLWTSLRNSGTVWGWRPRGPGEPDLTAKIFWGSVDFDYRRKEDYDLKVTGRRLDGDAPPLVVDKVTNALFVPNAAMLSGVYIPTPGCWEITGDYKGEKLSFVVWLHPVEQGNQ